MHNQKTDVIVVGAGPVGLTAAIGLAQAGIKIVIVDALAEAENTSRAAVIHSATLDCLTEVGITGRLIDQGIKAPNFRVRDRSSILLHANFERLHASSPFALMIPQDETEAIMLDRLEQLGQSVQRRVRFTAMEEKQDCILATFEGPEGAFNLSAKYLVGADGEGSTVRTARAIDFPGKSHGSFLLADVRMNWPIANDEVSLFFSSAGTLVVAPMSRGRHRIVAQMPNAPPMPTVGDVQRLVDERGPGVPVRIDEILWGSRFQVHHRLASRFRDGRVLLIGDAAHVHSPAGGQGMNLGLRDAVALSAALPKAIATPSAPELDKFARERREAAAKVLTMTDRLTKIATMASPHTRSLRNHIIGTLGRLPPVRSYVAETLAGFR